MLNIDQPETLICDNVNIIKMILDTRHIFIISDFIFLKFPG